MTPAPPNPAPPAPLGPTLLAAGYDWQFWIATVIVAFAAAWLLRGILPIPLLTRRHNRRKHQKRVSLTVAGKSVK
jgi:hypothetical protein